MLLLLFCLGEKGLEGEEATRTGWGQQDIRKKLNIKYVFEKKLFQNHLKMLSFYFSFFFLKKRGRIKVCCYSIKQRGKRGWVRWQRKKGCAGNWLGSNLSPRGRRQEVMTKRTRTINERTRTISMSWAWVWIIEDTLVWIEKTM